MLTISPLSPSQAATDASCAAPVAATLILDAAAEAGVVVVPSKPAPAERKRALKKTTRCHREFGNGNRCGVTLEFHNGGLSGKVAANGCAEFVPPPYRARKPKTVPARIGPEAMASAAKLADGIAELDADLANLDALLGPPCPRCSDTGVLSGDEGTHCFCDCEAGRKNQPTPEPAQHQKTAPGLVSGDSNTGSGATRDRASLEAREVESIANDSADKSTYDDGLPSPASVKQAGPPYPVSSHASATVAEAPPPAPTVPAATPAQAAPVHCECVWLEDGTLGARCFWCGSRAALLTPAPPPPLKSWHEHSEAARLYLGLLADADEGGQAASERLLCQVTDVWRDLTDDERAYFAVHREAEVARTVAARKSERNWLGKVAGQWPGEESEAELLAEFKSFTDRDLKTGPVAIPAEPQFAAKIEAAIAAVEARHCSKCGHVAHDGPCSQCGSEGECAPEYDPLAELRRIEDRLEDAAAWIENQIERVRNQIRHVVRKQKGA